MGSNSSSINYDENENIHLIDSGLKCIPFSPSPENKTKYLYLSGNKLTTLPRNMKNIILLDISNNKMGPSFPPGISSALTGYANLKTLYLTKNQLENFDNFENSSVETISLTQNRFRELPYHFLSKFPKLRTLYLDCNFISSFSKQTSESIVTVSLPLNCIRTIETSTLNLPQLTILDLSKNQIKELPNNFSKSFPKLQCLNLSDNFISVIPENANNNNVFPDSLKELNVSNNLIEKVPNSVTSLSNLKQLNIENNEITSIPKLNPSLEKLIASNNKIKSIEEQELANLNELQIDNNELTSFPTTIKLPKIDSLCIHHNKITEINFYSIPINDILSQNLTRIDLSFNQIESIPKELFECLPNLYFFTAFFNEITAIPSEISNCKKLSSLEISNNPIKKLPKLPRSLQQILASNCQIESFGEDSFVDPIQPDDDSQVKRDLNLRQLDLSGNQIESFSTFSSIQYLNLSQNKIKKMPVITDNLRVFDISMNLLESKPESMPEFISGSSLIEVNLSHNKLTKIPLFQSVPILQYLELSGNKISGSLDITQFVNLERIDISETNISISGDSRSLKEIISTNKELNEKTVYLKIEKSGYSEILGMRSEMEDSIILRDDLNLYAVCDGHG